MQLISNTCQELIEESTCTEDEWADELLSKIAESFGLGTGTFSSEKFLNNLEDYLKKHPEAKQEMGNSLEGMFYLHQIQQRQAYSMRSILAKTEDILRKSWNTYISRAESKAMAQRMVDSALHPELDTVTILQDPVPVVPVAAAENADGGQGDHRRLTDLEKRFSLQKLAQM